MTDLDGIVAAFQALQQRICAGLETIDGEGRFKEDAWERPGGGGGQARVVQGKRIEKGGVNFSHVHGPMPAKISNRLNLPEGTNFHATGVSIVLHARHPLIPIIHMNVRYFQTDSGKWWFGGGIDVTPIYINPDQARWFHHQVKAICDTLRPDAYPEFKAWADRYFFLKHRNETRGIGGIFFDHLTGKEPDSKETFLRFCIAVGDLFVPVYEYLVKANEGQAIEDRHWRFQRLRRSRYVEFNLIWDTGTRFGLDTGGRTESILMSMPPEAAWEYNYIPEPGSEEARTLELLQPVDWLNFS